MTVRHMLLVVGAVLVLGMAVYLALEVGRTPEPAQAEVTPVRRGAGTSAGTPAPAADRAPTRTRTPSPPERARPAIEPRPATPAGAPLEMKPAIPERGDAKLDLIMSEANKAYDRGDFDEAKSIATKVLAQAPGNVRMLRILVSSDCIMGDQLEAQKNYVLLPLGDRQQMRTRCARYGVTFTEPP